MMNEPEKQPEILMTPVEFSPPPSDDAVGTILPAPRKEAEFPVFVPLVIILLTLIFSTVRDIVALNRRLTIMNFENAPALEYLKKGTKQLEFRDALKDGLTKLAPTDPVAARILQDFYAPPAKKTDSPDDAKPPAQ